MFDVLVSRRGGGGFGCLVRRDGLFRGRGGQWRRYALPCGSIVCVRSSVLLWDVWFTALKTVIWPWRGGFDTAQCPKLSPVITPKDRPAKTTNGNRRTPRVACGLRHGLHRLPGDALTLSAELQKPFHDRLWVLVAH